MFDAGGIESGRVVLLSADEREVLCRMVADNTDSAGRVRRAKILLAAESQGAECNFGLIAKNVGASVRTVRRVCERYVAGGLRTSVFASRFNLVVKLCRADRICLNKILSDNSGNSNNSGTKNANTFNLTKSTSVAATKCNIKFAKILTKADADGEAADVGEIAAYSGATKRTVVRTLRTYIESGLSAILISRKLMRFRLTDVDRRRCELLQVTAKSQKIRKQAAILLNADRLECVVDFGEVAKLSGVSKQTVLRNCKKYKSGGLDNVINTTPYKSRLPKRRYAVRLTSQERDFLNRLTTTHKSGEKYKRGLILLNADERGVNRHNTEIAKIADVNVQTVLDVCRRYNESGLKQLFGNTLNSKSRFNVAQNAEIDRVPRKRRFEINLTKQERKQLLKITNNTSNNTAKRHNPANSEDRIVGAGLAPAQCRNSKGRINRAKVILTADEICRVIDKNGNKTNGKSDPKNKGASAYEIAQRLKVSVMTVCRTCERYAASGLMSAIDHKHLVEPTRAFVLDENQEAKLFELYKNPPPDGHKKWTIDLLTKTFLTQKLAPKLSRETVRKLLKRKSK